MNEPFTFKSYDFDATTRTATFRYAYGDTWQFTEKVTFASVKDGYNKEVLDRALFLAWIMLGISYYKTFPTRVVAFDSITLDDRQTRLFNMAYQEGLSQFAFENTLTRHDLACFPSGITSLETAIPYAGSGIIALQSGGKDSLLTASILREKGATFTPWYVRYGASHPSVLDALGTPLREVTRTIDIPTLKSAQAAGGLNGHVPVTYMLMSLALVDAILINANIVLVSVGHEGDEPHGHIDDLPINHQWSKTWIAELLFADYVTRYISPDLRIGSPLRGLSELRIAELFAEHAWHSYGHRFSSCNVANYKQGGDNTTLTWCGECPKCANSFLLFAPFVEPSELRGLFGGQNLFAKASLTETFKGLLGIEGVMKPLECIGEVDELRRAYHMAREKWPNAGYSLSFEVPPSNFNYLNEYDAQKWARDLLF